MTAEVTLIDVTLRDGGYVNQHLWQRSDAVAVVRACAEAKVLQCEIGYFRPRRHAADGAHKPAACCPPDYVAELRDCVPGITLVAMAHAHDIDVSDYRALYDSGVRMVRMPARLEVLPNLPPHVAAARAAGLRVAVNLIRASEVSLDDVSAGARLAQECGADVFYIADSNGSLFPEDVARLVEAAAEGTQIPLGFHAHDDLSLAFSNSLTAMRAGCAYLDASLAGMGKGGGNLSLELLAGYLRSRNISPFAMAPLVQAAENILKPWKNGVSARCESIASGLLNMNIDAIANHRSSHGEEKLISIVDALPV
jgi:4-hydroxy 2-oxovalerate aldolase